MHYYYTKLTIPLIKIRTGLTSISTKALITEQIKSIFTIIAIINKAKTFFVTDSRPLITKLNMHGSTYPSTNTKAN